MSASQCVDLDDVAAYLKERHLLDDRHLPYYVRWLQRFLAGPGGDASLSAEDAHRAFLERLDRSGDVPEWQVRQAARAVELLQKHYIRYRVESAPAPVGSPATEGLPPVPTSPTTLDAGIAEVRRLVRLRHYSYRTEQTYLGWLSQYANYVQRAGLAWDATDTVRAFLAELALKRGVAASTQNQAFCALEALAKPPVYAS
jgi:hypothetical protein